MDARVLEVLNQLIVLVIFSIIISREISSQSFDLLNTAFSIGGMIFLIILM